MELTDDNQTADEFYNTLRVVAQTIGGMICHFEKEKRSLILMGLTESIGIGLMETADLIGEPSDIEMIVGGRDGE